MAFLRNAWYVAALLHEIEGEALFSRKLLGDSVLIYRLHFCRTPRPKPDSSRRRTGMRPRVCS
jgi:hypothetical protein